jgi:hypothetical protein
MHRKAGIGADGANFPDFPRRGNARIGYYKLAAKLFDMCV